ncbi:succinate dehydrogenase / fumarate reductase cytochrome b subunit [Wenyingzhuangia heitensis]|uniref:Succinate dehydrogenase / fumarate reductase cytochrome b subunit n=1 Tax=Wenyingzhuangia heitensis TaxID=1487859 RepID=A0ABX0U4W3_9FLAO|nr:succinate dehydrogenase cytochrome b subunit [Wenyingzhuangia heitensis]NIJ43894.1 succinate dehydrogenase / fumarate reductase cytochrome b subunit [Wenyingzhuangia heitensis]
MSGFLSSSIGRKVAMALSAFFLMFFLIMHIAINLTSLFSEDLFNQLSHFMGTNPLVQFALQPVLILGVVFHFVMGFVLEAKNKSARNIKYVKNNGAANSTWVSRNMIYSGLAILAFIVLHFVDFWFPEINHKYIAHLPTDPNRYFGELVHKFHSPVRTGAYVAAFAFLALHLLHGFKSAFQSSGMSAKRAVKLETASKIYAIGIPVGFIIIALFHHFNQH